MLVPRRGDGHDSKYEWAEDLDRAAEHLNSIKILYCTEPNGTIRFGSDCVIKNEKRAETKDLKAKLHGLISCLSSPSIIGHPHYPVYVGYS